MAARGAKAKRKSSSARKKSSVSSARANKLAAFGFTGFVVLMAGAAAIALDLPAKAALSAGEAVGSAGFRVDGYQIVGLSHMDRKLVDAVVIDELRRVQWPDRRQVGQGTAVVIGFVVVAGVYLGVLDAIWNPIVQAII